MSELTPFFESLLQEATALEVYQQTFADKLSPEEYINILIIDPTATVGEGDNPKAILANSKKGAYTDWIFRQYKNCGGAAAKQRFIIEDGEALRQKLEAYKALTQNKEGVEKLTTAMNRANLKVANVKDLNSFKTEDMLSQAVSSFLQKTDTGNVEAPKDLGIKPENAIKVVYNDDVWQVVIPLTHAADRKYGAGTEWCTATNNPRWFKDYTKDGPLFIIRSKLAQGRNCKWQYHKQSNQFMDFADNSIAIRRFLLSHLSPSPEKTKAMALAISKASGAAAWDPERLERNAAKDKETILKAIQEANGDVNEALIGKTPVVLAACKMNNIDLLDTLLSEYHADPVVYDTKGYSALDQAIVSQSIDMAKMLIQAGPSPEAMLVQRGANGNSAIHLAAMSGNPMLLNSIISLLPAEKKAIYLNLRNNRRQTPLIAAILDAHTDNSCLNMIKTILEALESIATPRQAAIIQETIRIMLQEDGNASSLLNLRDSDGGTPLYYAITKGFPKSAQHLRDLGAEFGSSSQIDWDDREILGNLLSSAPEIIMDCVAKMSPDRLMGVLRQVSNLADLEGTQGAGDAVGEIEYASSQLAENIIKIFEAVISKLIEAPGSANTRKKEALEGCMFAAAERLNLPLIKYLHEIHGIPVIIGGDWSIITLALEKYCSPTKDLVFSIISYAQSASTKAWRYGIDGFLDNNSIFEDNVSSDVRQLLLSKATPDQIQKMMRRSNFSDIACNYTLGALGREFSGGEDVPDAIIASPEEEQKLWKEFLGFSALKPKEDDDINTYFIINCFYIPESFKLVQWAHKTNPQVAFTNKSGIYTSLVYILDSAPETVGEVDIFATRTLKDFLFIRKEFPEADINARENMTSPTALDVLLDNRYNSSSLDDEHRRSPAYASLMDTIRSWGGKLGVEINAEKHGKINKGWWNSLRAQMVNPPPPEPILPPPVVVKRPVVKKPVAKKPATAPRTRRG